jgi:hypothetical protein
VEEELVIQVLLEELLEQIQVFQQLHQQVEVEEQEIQILLQEFLVDQVGEDLLKN